MAPWRCALIFSAITVPTIGVKVVVDHAPAETFVRSENLGAHPGRALFLGGLEGTGHHFWMQVFRACEAQGSCVQSSSRLDFAHWTQRDDSDHVDLAWQMETQHNIPGTLILNGGDFGMLSYPNHMPWEYPRLDNYFSAAVKANVDLRTLVLLRDPDDSLASIRRRTAGDTAEYPRTGPEQVKGAHMLMEHLKTQPRSSWMCVDMETFPSFTEKLETFLGPTSSQSTDDFDHISMIKKLYTEEVEHHCEEAACQSAELREAVSELRTMCESGVSLGDVQSDLARAQKVSQVWDFVFGE